jgi:hypothetical protein
LVEAAYQRHVIRPGELNINATDGYYPTWFASRKEVSVTLAIHQHTLFIDYATYIRE